MNGNVGMIITPLLLASATTAVKTGKDGGDVPRVLFASVVWFGALTVVGQMIGWRLAAAIAWVHFLYVFLNQGKPAITWVTDLVDGF